MKINERSVFATTKNHQNAFAAVALPQTPLTEVPQTPSHLGGKQTPVLDTFSGSLLCILGTLTHSASKRCPRTHCIKLATMNIKLNKIN